MNFYIVRSRHAAKNRFLEINAAERPEKLPLASKASHAAAGAVTRKRPPTAAMRRMAARQSRFSRRAKHAYGTANLNDLRAREPWPQVLRREPFGGVPSHNAPKRTKRSARPGAKKGGAPTAPPILERRINLDGESVANPPHVTET